MTSSPIPAARSQYLPGLLTQIPDPRRRRGRRHPLAGLLAVGIAAVIAGSKSFAAIGQWAADAGPEVLAALGAARGAAEESTFRRAFALVSPDKLDQVLGSWLWTRAVQVKGRLVIAIDGKAVRGARDKDGKAPHLVVALAHGIGAVLGQVAVTAKSNEIPAVRDLLNAFTDLAGAVITIDALHTRSDTAQVITGRRQGQHADAVPAAEEAALGAHPRRLFREHGPRPPGPPHDQGRPGAGLDRVRRRRPGRAAAPHGHEKGKKTVEVVYLITSDSDVGPAALAAWVRGHWEIENKLHWVRDVPTRKTNRWSEPGTRPASWQSCATWPSASCAWTATPTSPPPIATMPAT